MPVSKKSDHTSKPLRIMVSSAVYGIEELLEGIYALLTDYGYEVWMSHKGTVPIRPNMSASDSCLYAAENCDIFLGIITPWYGSGRNNKDELTVTHEELLRAFATDRPRWFLVHQDIPKIWRLLRAMGHDTAEKRALLSLGKKDVISDFKILDMYETAIQHDPSGNVRIQDRDGNWAQEFSDFDHALNIAQAQFFRYREVAAFIKDQFEKPKPIRDLIVEQKRNKEKVSKLLLEKEDNNAS